MPTTPPNAAEALATLTEAVRLGFRDELSPPALVGIHTGGCWIADELGRALDIARDQIGQLDVGFHRDDFAERGMRRVPLPTRLQGDLSGRPVLLIDDVLHSGRTIRAAINALFEFGRPSRIWLAVLADRGGRQLPISPDFVGVTVDIPADQMLRLSGPDPLTLTLQSPTSSP